MATPVFDLILHHYSSVNYCNLSLSHSYLTRSHLLTSSNGDIMPYSFLNVLSCLGWSLHGQVNSTFFLYLVFLNKSPNGFSVHSSMLSIHRILGLPCFLAPGVVPCMIYFSRQSPFLIMCPKYDNFVLLIILSSPRSIPAVLKRPPMHT